MKTFIGLILPYLSLSIFVIGTIYRVARLSSVPNPHIISLFPLPKSKLASSCSLIKDVIFFRKLFENNKSLWTGTFLFHIGLFLALIGHFVGIPFEGNQFVLLGFSIKESNYLSNMLGGLAGIMLFAGLFILLIRRIMLFEIRVLSDPSDYFDLVILLLIALTGNGMRFLSPLEYAQAKTYLLGILTFTPVPVPDNIWFILHFTMVLILIIYFPMSKMFHCIGAFFLQAIIKRNKGTEINKDMHKEIEEQVFYPKGV